MTDAFTDEFPAEDDTAGLTPAAEGSTLATIRDRRKQAKTKLHLDLEVPRLEPPIYVRFKPTTQTRLNAASVQAGKLKANKDAEVIANAGILVDACLGVYEVIDGVEVSVDFEDRGGEWLKFGKRLAELLVSDEDVKDGEKRPATAAEVVRALYLTDGDIISTVTKLGTWSGYANDQYERDTEGN